MERLKYKHTNSHATRTHSNAVALLTLSHRLYGRIIIQISKSKPALEQKTITTGENSTQTINRWCNGYRCIASDETQHFVPFHRNVVEHSNATTFNQHRSEEACMHIGSLVHLMPHSHAFATNITCTHSYTHTHMNAPHQHTDTARTVISLTPIEQRVR